MFVEFRIQTIQNLSAARTNQQHDRALEIRQRLSVDAVLTKRLAKIQKSIRWSHTAL